MRRIPAMKNNGKVGRLRFALVVAVGLTAVSTACSSGGDGDAAPDAAAATVSMKLVAYQPEALTVAAGTSVTWTQEDAGFHTVTSGVVEQGAAGVTAEPDGKFDSGQVATDETFVFEFTEAGTYPYFCTIHPATMRGEVTVT